jgi:hypothetical protein
VGKKKEVKTYGTMTDELLAMAQWLKENNVQKRRIYGFFLGSDGKHRFLLETNIQHIGSGGDTGNIGERAAYKIGTRAKNRRKGFGMDSGFTEAWVVEGEFRAKTRDEGIARTCQI